MIPGIGAISGGSGGGQSFEGGSADATLGDNSRGGSNTWNFAPPQYQARARQQQAVGQQYTTVAIIGGVVVMAWLLTRKS
jgi:hypothetical protein